MLDQRHTFVGSIVATPQSRVAAPLWRAPQRQQFGLAIQMASGIPLNVRSNRELNNDGVASDRPVGVGATRINLPARRNVDLRLSRRVPIARTHAEVIAEVKNLFNTVQWSNANATVATDTAGVPLAALPARGSDLNPTGGYEQRQLQLGFRLTF
jgi:hypothetical protein